jgi:hypothetical protein
MIEPEQEFNQQYLPPVKKFINKKGLLIITVISLIIILLIIFLVNFFSFQQSLPVKIQPSPEQEIFVPHPTLPLKLETSFLATDAAVLKTKAEVAENINLANSIDLSESNLTFPILDFEIGFQ